VLAAVPNSRLILKSLSFNDPATRDRLLSIIAAAGVASERVELLSWEPLLKGHLETYHRIDIALDTLPYNGTTTTCEAAWMGVPTVALCGDRHAARVGATINQTIGLPELVAADEAGFVKATAALAADIPALAALRAGLRAKVGGSALCDGRAFAGKFETTLRSVWKDWCDGTPQTQQPDAAANEHWRKHPALIVFEGTPATGRRLQVGARNRVAGWETLNILPGPEVDHLGDCQDLSRFADGSFDVIYGSHVLEHVALKDAVTALKEWHRVLAPGGQALISVPNVEAIMRLFLAPERTANEKLHLTRMIYGGQIDDFDYHYTGYFPELLEHVLREAGFAKVVHVKEFGLFGDTSSLRFKGELISLNTIAQKPV
jgi:predicted SAM-dependent methyltransferase